MGLFSNYDTPGRGVLKTPHEKKGFFKFWEIYGRHMWKLMELNLLYFLFCLPSFAAVILGLMTFNPLWLVFCIPGIIIGPATAAMTRVTRNFSQERPAFVMHDFFKSFKLNLKQGLIMGLIDNLFVVWLIVGIPIYKSLAERDSMMYIPFVISLACALMFVMMHFYIYQMMCSTNLTMVQILKNSLFLVNLSIKQTIYTLLSTITVLMLVYLFMPYTYFLIPFFPMTFITFVACFNCYPVIRKHVIMPYYEQRGELDPETAAAMSDPDEALFVDKAAEETPVKATKKVKKIR